MSAAQPLSGVRVLELGSYITAPKASVMLADLGAEVIKIENPKGGDPFRAFKGGNYSPHFRTYNRSKQSLALNFSTDAGREVLRKLAARSDVLIENFRPGTLDRMGVGYEDLHAINPRLVYCSITGFGPTGPYRDRPSYDTVGQALSGLLSLSVDPDDPQLTGTALSDSVTGMYTAYAVLAGLHERDTTGVGRHLEISMVEATIAFIEGSFVQYALNGEVPGIVQKSIVNQSFAFRCSDGKLVAIHLSSPPKFWDALVAALEAPQLADDPRFSTRAARSDHYEALRLELGALFVRQPRSHWVDVLERHDVPFAPVYGVDEVAGDPQVQHFNLFRTLVHPVEGPTEMVARPARFDGQDGFESAVAPPQLGEHSDSVLSALGYSADEIDALQAAGVIAPPAAAPSARADARTQ